MAPTRLTRRTTCRVPGHATWCESSRDKDDSYPRGLEERLALQFELEADTIYRVGRVHW